MKKRITATAALLFSLFGALMLAGVSPAQAAGGGGGGGGGYSCHNDSVVGVIECSTVVLVTPVTLKITGNRVLTNNELNVLSGNLNNIGNNLNVLNLKNVAIGSFGSFSPPITLNLTDINVCIASICA